MSAEEYDEIADVLDLPEDLQEEEQEASQEAQAQEPEPEPVVEPEPVAEDSGDAEPEPESELSVLMGKMDSLERANSGLYRELREERDRRQQLMSEIKDRSEKEQAAKRKADSDASVPDKDEDPIGYLSAKVEQRLTEISERFDGLESSRHEQAKADAYRQAEMTVNSAESRFAEKNPAYYDALDFARRERYRMLEATHPEQSPEWLSGMIQQGDRMFALQSLKQGVDPAQRAWDYAVRLGFDPAKSGGNGGAVPASAPAETASPAPAKSPPARPQQTSLSAVASKPGGRGRKITYEEAVATLDTDPALFDRLMEPGGRHIAELQENGHTYV